MTESDQIEKTKTYITQLNTVLKLFFSSIQYIRIHLPTENGRPRRPKFKWQELYRLKTNSDGQLKCQNSQ